MKRKIKGGKNSNKGIKPFTKNHKIFTFIARNISFGFGISFFSILGSWFAVVYGFFFIYGNRILF